jgi:catalase-peroxidase
MMTTADMALKVDPEFRVISREVPRRPRSVQGRLRPRLVQADPPRHGSEGPLPRAGSAGRGPHLAGSGSGRQGPEQGRGRAVQRGILESGLTIGQLVKTAWASASTYRKSDHRGGANGARIRLEPQIGWDVNEPEELSRVLAKIDELRGELSMADAIVLAGLGGGRQGGARCRLRRHRSFTGGRGDATQEWTDAESFAVMEPAADGFRNYLKTKHSVKTEELLLDRPRCSACRCRR